VFFLSADDKLLVKTIRKAEFDLLRRLLPAYYSHMLAHPNSLLVRVYGLYSITSASSGGRKVGSKFAAAALLCPASGARDLAGR
jgi:1-phosphatidylinositol-4-phosphate 5-kinase